MKIKNWIFIVFFSMKSNGVGFGYILIVCAYSIDLTSVATYKKLHSKHVALCQWTREKGCLKTTLTCERVNMNE